MRKIFDKFDPKHKQNYRIVSTSSLEGLKTKVRIQKKLRLGILNISYTRHAEDMMEERGFDHADVKHALLNGEWKETREYEHRRGSPREIFIGPELEGSRKLTISVREERNLMVITVIG